jgi:hypothetical protein
MNNEQLAISNDFIEAKIIEAVKGLLTGRVNEVLAEWQSVVPLFEIPEFMGRSAVFPVIKLSGCERTEKERIIRLDAYTMTISFTLHETPESELYCYGYSAAFEKALNENPTLGGVVDRVVITGKKYTPPKIAYGGDKWEVVLTLRITVEELSNDN